MAERVHEVMSPVPVTVGPELSALDLLAAFDRHDYNAFPVVDERGALRGIVTKLDVLRIFRPGDRGAESLPAMRVADLMRQPVVAVDAQDSLATAADVMVEARLHSLPVVDRRSSERALVGMVSRGDLLRALRFRVADPEGRPGA
jgi:tRNA nucleotidyltransferase (CCA-adding enzyme)